MVANIETHKANIQEWLTNETEISSIWNRLLDNPGYGISAWSRTTAGVVAFLFILQILTGVMMAFHYVPSIENAHTTVAYIEKGVQSGAWIRSLHYHSSIWLPVALIAHLTQMILRNSYMRLSVAWVFSLVLLGLVLAAGATGYALPWDARSFNGVNVAVSLAGNTPLIGASAQAWIQNGKDISTLTISRFYALHVFVMPALMLACVAARLFLFRSGNNRQTFKSEEYKDWSRKQLVRNAIVIVLVFIFAAYFSAKYPAPFAPTPQEATDFLPRPGPQFLWLFEMQKYLHGALSSIIAAGFPALIIGGLISIPLIAKLKLLSFVTDKHRLLVSAFFMLGFVVVTSLTVLAVYQDTSDPRTSAQLAKQEEDEKAFRTSPFKPRVINLTKNATEEKSNENDTNASSDESAHHSSNNTVASVTPASYIQNCAKCHGKHGEGVSVFPPLTGISTREEERRTQEDLMEIINNPKAFGFSSKMASYKDKLTEEEKQEIVKWMMSLK